jgi:ion channel POLLUX/CASTOR
MLYEVYAMQKPSLRERVTYWFDRWMARGFWAMVWLLFLVTVLVALLVALAAHLSVPETAGNVGDSLWKSFMHILDPGNVNGDYETRNTCYILLMILAAVCGLFVTSVLIGMITSAFHARLEKLRHGNAKVLERGHTLILGYDEHLTTVLSEMIAANASSPGAAIVLLNEHSRHELEASCAPLMGARCRTRVICRSGDPTCFHALRNVAIDRCARVIALGTDDFEIIKIILAANTLLNECGAPEQVTISAIIRMEENMPAAQIAGGERAELLYFERLIARIFAQTCRQTGLAQVYQDLFDYRGDEIYTEKAPTLAGVSFAEAVLRYRDAAVLGLKRNGRVWLNPPGETQLSREDEIILVASDAGAALVAAKPGAVDQACIRLLPSEPEQPLRLLILGNSPHTENIIGEIAQYAREGSTLTVASEGVIAGEQRHGGLLVRFVPGSAHRLETMEALLAEEPDCVTVLAEDGVQDADARTLTLLLQLSRYYREHPGRAMIVSEMQSKKNQALAACARVNDFVVGTNIASLVLTQVARDRSLHALFDDLLTDEGNEIYIRPVGRYIHTGVPVNLYTLAAAAMQCGQAFIGLRLLRTDGGYDVRINPDKAETVVFTQGDGVIVLAED